MISPVTEPNLIAVLGPTAVGKTAISLQLARQFDGEIISADSRQIYRGLDIGTDKIGPAERGQIPHHLIDVVAPDEVLTLAEYQRLAFAAVDAIHGRGHLPILTGGTGLYVRSVLDGLGIPEVPPDFALREELEAYAAASGAESLHARLAALDPNAAASIDYRNVRRVVRALEVCLVTGEPISRLQRATPPPFRILRIGLTRPRETLFERIDQRVEEMMASGLLEEVETLLAVGYDMQLPALTGLGYRQMIQHIRGELTLVEAVEEIKRQTRRFVRQQSTWFRRDDPRIRWFDLEQTQAADIDGFVAGWLADEGLSIGNR